MDPHRKEKKTKPRSSEKIGSMRVTGDGRREGREGGKWRTMYSSIKPIKVEKFSKSAIFKI